MKKIILLITAIVILLCIYHVKDVYYKPYKYALKLEEINNDNYIICNVVQTTGFNWRTQDGELINVVGKAPFSKDGKFKSFDIEFGNNKFILYGNYTDDVYYYGEEKKQNI